MKLHWKIALGALLVSAAALLAGDLYVRPALRADITEQIAESLGERATLVAGLLKERTGEELEPARLQPWLMRVSGGAITRITLIDPEGRVLADSGVTMDELPKMENHGSRPEVLEARRLGKGRAERRSATLKTDLLYVARRVRLGGGWGVLRLAYPLSAVGRAVGRVQKIYSGAIAVALLLALVLSVFVSRWVARPLRVLGAAARRIAEGDLSVRIESHGRDEVGELGGAFNDMAQQLGQSLAANEGEREQARRILSTVEEGILLLDERDRVAAANRAFVRMFDLADEPTRGRSPLELARTDALERALASLRRGEERFEEEFVLEAPLGRRRFELAAVPVVEAHERRGAVLVFRDVTRTRQLERVRKDFVANVSHELRTPLTTIRGYAETLSERLAGQEPLGRFAAAILKSAESLGALVGDLLELSRLERPEFSLHKERADLAAELSEGIGGFAGRAQERSLGLHFEPGAFDHHLCCDRRLIGQVLLNLLDNALKYTPAGGDVWVRTAEEAGALRVSVLDTGPGIPEKDLSRLFERFYRVDKARSRELGGTGLGLSIVKHVIERHGGRVGADNRPGGGACFWFTLPRG